MKKILSLGAATLCLTSFSAGAIDGNDMTPLERHDASRMSALLDGKTPGDAQSCLPLNRNMRSSIIGDSTILYRAGNTVYRTDFPGGCGGLRSDRSISRTSTTSHICQGDSIQIVDPSTGTTLGNCVLGDFTPYRRN